MGKQQHDNYPTDLRLSRAIVNTLQVWMDGFGIRPDIIIEPSCGEGSFIKAAREFWPQAYIVGMDIVDYTAKVHEAGATFFRGDWALEAAAVFEHALKRGARPLVVGNPPFSFAQQHIEAAMALLPHGCWLAFLLRLGFLGSAERAQTFWPHCGKQQRFLLPIAGRPSYVKFKNVEVIETVDGVDYPHKRRKKVSTTDNSEYGIFVFEKGYTGPCIKTDPLIWKAAA